MSKLVWSDDPPSVFGWYWMRRPEDDDPHIIPVFCKDDVAEYAKENAEWCLIPEPEAS